MDQLRNKTEITRSLIVFQIPRVNRELTLIYFPFINGNFQKCFRCITYRIIDNFLAKIYLILIHFF